MAILVEKGVYKLYGKGGNNSKVHITFARVRVLKRPIGNVVRINGYTRSCKFHKRHFQAEPLTFCVGKALKNGNEARRPAQTLLFALSGIKVDEERDNHVIFSRHLLTFNNPH